MFEIVQAVFAAASAVGLLAVAGITLGGSLLALVVSTPLFLIFSPVLVPATVATTFLATGLAASGGSGISGLTILLWLYKKFTGKDPPKIPGVKPPSTFEEEEEEEEE